jgi:hypothetical protein
MNKLHGTAVRKVPNVDTIVLCTVNAPYRRNITAAALEKCIATAELGAWCVHVVTFFREVSPRLIFEFARSHGISASSLATAYRVMKASTGEQNPDLEAELVRLAPPSR